MGNLNSANVQSYGDVTQRIWWAELGTPVPTTPTGSWGLGWHDLGLISDAGLTESQTDTSTDVFAWQGGAKVAVLRSQFGNTFKFAAMEDKAEVFLLRRPYATIATTPATAEVQAWTMTGTGTAGTWTPVHPLFGPAAAQAYNVATSSLATALSTAWGGTFTVTGTAGSVYNVTYPATYGDVALPSFANAITGVTAITPTVTTPGVNPINSSAVGPSTNRKIRQFGIDLVSGTVNRRFIVPLGEAQNSSDVVYVANAVTVYEFTVDCILDGSGNFYYELNNSPVLTASSLV